MLLQLISTSVIASFIFKNSESDSQNMLPNWLEERPMNLSPELLFSRSMQSLLPALSSRRFKLKLRETSDLLTFRAYARNLDPS